MKPLRYISQMSLILASFSNIQTESANTQQFCKLRAAVAVDLPEYKVMKMIVKARLFQTHLGF